MDGSPIMDTSHWYSGDWSKIMAYPYSNVPDNFIAGSFDNDFRRRRPAPFRSMLRSRVRLTIAHGSCGGAGECTRIDVYNRTGLTSSSGERNEIYAAKPFESGVYVQDKMEFEGMIANIGLRLDVWNQNVVLHGSVFPVPGADE